MNLALLLLVVAASGPDEAVLSGRKALDHWSGYPWYDSATDGVRRIDVAPEGQTPEDADRGTRLGEAAGSIPLDPLLQWLAWIGIALLLSALIYLLGQAYLHRQQDEAAAGPSASGDADRIESLPLVVANGRLDLLAEARRHLQHADYARAIVYLFAFQLLQLDKRQIIRLSKGKTNRQHLREIGPRWALRRLVEQTMVIFEEVFFGNRALERAGFESCWARLAEFESLAAEAAT